jgi:Spy/CpxP family protein refolding chaperone
MADHDPAKMTDGILQHLSETLNLTDDQKAKMKPIIQADVEQFQKDAETERQAMQKRMEDDKAKLKPLLNADQQKALDAMPMPGHPPAGDGEMGGEIPPPAPGK